MTALVTRAVQTLTVDRLMDLAADEGAAPNVRHIASGALRQLQSDLRLRRDVHGAGTREDIERFLARPDATRRRSTPPAAPPGEPIGG
jgi:hypothetical protein